MENLDDKELEEAVSREEWRDTKPFIVFHAFPIEMWFWRIAVVVLVVLQIIKLIK